MLLFAFGCFVAYVLIAILVIATIVSASRYGADPGPTLVAGAFWPVFIPCYVVVKIGVALGSLLR